ncbi:MAG TPA: ATP-dependent RNA helicase HrpA [Kofleriaceae bacterium]|nr:ATP-dependent RNA helicase HrpA [Kofleriaceae bacterium]
MRFPPELPITAHVDELARAIADHPLVIVAGETGSGKTTQLPKICLAMGRGAHGFIGCTQPRRIAATSVAARVAAELDTELGDVVGYKVRFNDRVRRESYVKFMTDGILLAEIHGDPMLRAYDTIIIDEAHERSLNIDFLLGFVKRLLPRRPELRIIISSATLAHDRFSEFFGGAPVVEVSGRTYPVDVLYRPPREDEVDLADTVASVVDEITDLDRRSDVLVFLPGEREIREAAAELEQRALPHTVVLPLYARLSAADQQRVFQTLPERRVILATNVAETSLTIPGIVYVVDSGVARINRYSTRTGVTQLHVEDVSRASADQRKGRCGRTQHGICFRLYEERDYLSRPAYTDPEILRVGLAGVILRMKALDLGEVATFPFLDPPAKRAIDEGYRVLEELGALDERGDLTEIGEQLGKLPVDPRLGRMILGGRDEGALRDVLVIAAALGLQDPRERPHAAQQKADEAHRPFRDEASDFAGYLRLWGFWREARSRGGKGAVSRLCRDHFLSYPRMREWEDIHEQLNRVVRELGFAPGEQAASAEALHRALLPGLLSKIGMWSQEARVYLGARQTRFALHPSSGLARKPPPWVMAAELVETSQLFARTVAKIDPLWLERAAGPLCRRSYSAPHWEQKAGQVMAKEQVTLFGLPIVSRKAPYGPIDPAAARELFIVHALVRGEYATKGPFMAHNRALLDEVARLRDKARKSDMVADEYAIAEFFEQRVPAGVFSGKTFEAWRKEAEARDPRVLHLAMEDVLLDEEHALTPAAFPDQLTAGGVALPLAYRFEPGEEDDGATVTVPLAVLPQLDPDVMAWTIPGWHRAKLDALVDSLPRAVRKTLAPTDELVSWLASALRPFERPMLAAVERAIEERTGLRVAREAWDLRAVPAHLSLTFRVVDEHDHVLGQGRDLAELQRTLGGRAQELWARAPRERHERTGLRAWELDELPASITVDVGGRRLRAYPALVDAESAVDLRLLESPAAAAEATRGGLRRLFLLAMQTTAAKLEAQLPASLGQAPLVFAAAAASTAAPAPPPVKGFAKLASAASPASASTPTRVTAPAPGPAPAPGAATPRRQLVLRALDEAFGLADPDAFPRTKAAFTARLAEGRLRLPQALAELGSAAADLAAELARVRAALRPLAVKHGPVRAAHDDVVSQLEHLLPADLLAATPLARLLHLVRYLRAIHVRLQRLPVDPQKDAAKASQVAPLWQAYRARVAALRNAGPLPAGLVDFGWLLEELRVQTFAPELGTAASVSPARLRDLWAIVGGV